MDLMKRLLVTVGVLGTAFTSTALADPVDDDGEARFKNVTGNYPFFTFASTEQLTSNPGSPNPEFIDAYADWTGDIYFETAFFDIYPTAQTIGVFAAQIYAQLVVTNVTGVVDFSSGTYFDWEITAQVKFRALGAAGVTTFNCGTAPFTIKIGGDYVAGATSSSFTIPALSGTGTGACNGHSTEINLDFALGTSGATLSLDKWGGYERPLASPPVLLHGS